MNTPDRLSQLLASLTQEISGARAGSDQNQFPILDLVGNLRDATGGQPALAEWHQLCADAWEKIVRIVESAQPFSQEHIQWLNELLNRLKSMAGNVPVAPPPPTQAPASLPTALPSLPLAPPTPAAPSAPVTAAACQQGHPLTPEEPPLVLNIESDADLLREFINESREHLDNIEQGVLVLENSPNDAETLNTVFRAFHTFKGGAGFLNLMPINRLAHVLESLLDMARRSEIEINAPVIEVILRGRDVLKQFVEEIDGQINGTRAITAIEIPTAELKAEVTRLMEGDNTSEEFNGQTAAPAPAKTDDASAPSKAAAEAPAGAESAPANQKNGDAAKAVVKVDTAKLDALLDLVGEMVIAESLVSQNLSQNREAGNHNAQFTRNLAQLGRITHELQRVGMSLRMVPIRGVFQKMARVARDISAKQQKKVQFLTSGEDTELDRGVVEELNDPLLHMIRNSMDHGIEAPDKRTARGKTPVGSLNLRAYHQGGNIVVEIEDDGAGLNRERIFAKAVERGLISPDAQLTDEEVFNFIFAAGFSTAEKITDLSGRGVGLDVVRRNIERLRGRVDISSKLGQGTLFKITLPLTLAIIDGLIVKVGEERYILPTLSVRESFRPTADMISRIHNRAEVVNVRGRLIPLLRLYDYFGIQPKSTEPTESIVVVAQAGTSIRCLLVDALLHKQEVVIKNLNDMMVHKNRALAGATILGDGRVGLILDVNTLVNQESQVFAQAA